MDDTNTFKKKLRITFLMQNYWGRSQIPPYPPLNQLIVIKYSHFFKIFFILIF